jgi:hypothetical protein
MGSDRGYVRNWQFASYRPIIFALTKDDPKLVEALLQHHADPNSKFTLYDNGNPLIQGATPLITAVRLNEPAIVEMLLTHEADVNRPDETGATPLHYATKFSNTNLAEILLRHDANSNAFDKNHQTPLFYAITFGMHDTNMVALLINHHADVNIANNNGYPPIYHVMGNPPETPLGAIREQLLKAGANENFVRLKQISIRRNNHETVIFTKGSNDWNHFTLFELISVVYGRNEAPNQRSQPGFAPGLRTIPTMPVYSPGNPLAAPVPGMIGGMSQTDNFQFPDLAQIIIRRISPVALTQLNRVPITALPGTQRDEKRYQVDLDNRFQSSDRGNDIPLEWGDIIEIPELDHPVNARWEGISSQTQHRLIGLLSSPIQIKIKTASTNLSVLPPMPNFPNTDMWRLYVRSAPNQTAAPNTIVSPFGLRAIVSAVGVLRSSSDTTHVKIVRHTDSNVRSITVNLQEGEELWIEPGDVIEIPDRGTDAASQPNQPPE